MLCARECPDWCIYIDSHKETIPSPTPGGRDRQRNVLDRFAIDFSLCMYCGICIEVCPFDALHWSPEFEYSELDIRDLLHEKDRLGQWMPTVPPPPALDPASAEPAESPQPTSPPMPRGADAYDRASRAGNGAPACGAPRAPGTCRSVPSGRHVRSVPSAPPPRPAHRHGAAAGVAPPAEDET